MSNFTKEDLMDIAYRGSYEDLERNLALQLLACMEQEPVAWWTGPEPTLTGEIESIHDHETGSHYIPLYPSYAAMLQSKVDDEVGSWNNHMNTPTAQAGNSPVTPDTWIPVSERMPEKGQEVLCTDQFHNYETALYDIGYIPGPPFFATTAGEFHPTHWMPLPAAPQQEVKP